MSDASIVGAGPVKPRYKLNLWLVGALLASLWSFYTTFRGMVDVLGNEIGAAFLTTIVWATLLGVSILLGKDIARWAAGRRATSVAGRGAVGSLVHYTIVLAMFALSFGISVFMSFSYYFNYRFEVGGSDALAAEAAVVDLGGLVAGIGRGVDNHFKEQERPPSDRPEGQAWLASLQSIVDVMKVPANRDAVVAAFTSGFGVPTQADLERTRSQGEEAKRALVTRQRDLQTRQVELDGVEQSFETRTKPLVETIQAKQTQIEQLEQAINKEKFQGDPVAGRAAGCGPVCRGLEAQKAAAEGMLRNAKADLDLAIERRDVVRRAVDDIKRDVEKLNETVRLGDDAAAQLDDLARGARRDPIPGIVAPLDEARRAFQAEPTKARYDAAVAACQRIRDTLQRAPDVLAAVQKESCESAAVVEAFGDRAPRVAARARFAEQCAPEVIDRRSKPILDRLVLTNRERLGKTPRPPIDPGPFAEMQQVVESCITLAAATGLVVAPYNEELRRFVSERSPAADRYARTLAAPTLAPGIAFFASSVSVMQDLFILVMSIFSDMFRRSGSVPLPVAGTRGSPVEVDLRPRDDDPPRAAAAKAILRALDREGRLVRGFEDRIADEGLRANVRHLLRQLYRDRHLPPSSALRRRVPLGQAGVEMLEQTIATMQPVRATLRPFAPELLPPPSTAAGEGAHDVTPPHVEAVAEARPADPRSAQRMTLEELRRYPNGFERRDAEPAAVVDSDDGRPARPTRVVDRDGTELVSREPPVYVERWDTARQERPAGVPERRPPRPLSPAREPSPDRGGDRTRADHGGRSGATLRQGERVSDRLRREARGEPDRRR